MDRMPLRFDTPDNACSYGEEAKPLEPKLAALLSRALPARERYHAA